MEFIFFQNEAEKGAAASVMSEENKLSCLVTQEKKVLLQVTEWDKLCFCDKTSLAA